VALHLWPGTQAGKLVVAVEWRVAATSQLQQWQQQQHEIATAAHGSHHAAHDGAHHAGDGAAMTATPIGSRSNLLMQEVKTGPGQVASEQKKQIFKDADELDEQHSAAARSLPPPGGGCCSLM